MPTISRPTTISTSQNFWNVCFTYASQLLYFSLKRLFGRVVHDVVGGPRATEVVAGAERVELVAKKTVYRRSASRTDSRNTEKQLHAPCV